MLDCDGYRSIGYLVFVKRIVSSHPKLISLRSHAAYRQSSGHFYIEGKASILNVCNIGLSTHWTIYLRLVKIVLNARAR